MGAAAGGHHYFVARIPQSRDVVPYVVHATFQFSGVEVSRVHPAANRRQLSSGLFVWVVAGASCTCCLRVSAMCKLKL